MQIKKCKYCNKNEFEEKFIWLNGQCLCRECYKNAFIQNYHRPYIWNDKDFSKQELEVLNR